MLILASSSPRRRQLLADAGYAFRVEAPRESAECGVCSRETLPQLVARLAFQKAADVAARIDEGLVLGADTVAACLGRVLGKPTDVAHAREMLTWLRGREHACYTGVCLWRRPDNRCLVRTAETILRMDDVPDAQLEAHLATDDWVGKAGAFGFQDGLDWLRVVRGSESNVVGLPLELLAEMLLELDDDRGEACRVEPAPVVESIRAAAVGDCAALERLLPASNGRRRAE